MTTLTMMAALLAAGGQDGLRIDAGFLPGREIRRTETVIVGYRDVWVSRPVTVYETRTTWREVVRGRDRRGRPIVVRQPVCERVPVTRWERVCEQQPIYGTRETCEPPPFRWGVTFGFGR